jgi:WD40 repeat protein/mono/diheme cytochrome c family protein
MSILSHTSRALWVGLMAAGMVSTGTGTALTPTRADEVPAASSEAAVESKVSFVRDVAPILRRQCAGCHQAAKAQGQYRLDRHAELLLAGESGAEAVVPGKPEASYLIDQITPVDGQALMPKGAPPLSDSQRELIRRWIAEGALDDSETLLKAYDAEHPPTYARPPVIRSLSFSPDDRWLAVSGHHEVLLFDTDSWQLRQRLIGASPWIESLAFSPDGERLAVGGGRPGEVGELQIWAVAEHQLLLSLSLSIDVLSGVSWSPDGSLVAFGGADNIVRAVDSRTGEQRLFQGAHEDWVRSTIFSVDGSHLVSTGRDRTVKLTEVASERFVDNITSITPGALQGGIHTLRRHPNRDEVLVGGSDGVPKLYRLFRQTERRIGDDANLLHRLPQLPGRIFAVDIAPQADWLAAAGSLDGSSEVVAWKYQSGGELPEDIRAIEAKTVFERSPEDRQKLAAFVGSAPEQVGRWSLETAVYALALSGDQRLAVGGADGRLRVYAIGPSGSGDTAGREPLLEVSVVPDGASAESDAGRIAQQARTDYLQRLEQQPVRTQTAGASPAEVATQIGDGSPPATGADALAPLPLATEWVALEVTPEAIELKSWTDYVQLIVTAIDRAGRRQDVTRKVSYRCDQPLVVVDRGWVQPSQAGQGQLRIELAELSSELPVRVHGSHTGPVDFVRDVNPVLSKAGCNAGTCHGALAGKNGFKLSLRGYDPLFDVRALTDDLSSRRVDRADPHASLMLAKPLGHVPHQGGVLLEEGDRAASIIEQWILAGAPLKEDGPRVSRIELFPSNPIIADAGLHQQFRVLAHYSDGLWRDVTAEAFIESSEIEVATVDQRGYATSLRRGEAPLLARFEGAYAATTLTVMGDRDGFQWDAPETWSDIDVLVADKWQRLQISPASLADDATFLRRVYLDLTGLPPSAAVVRQFLADTRPLQQKRQAVIDQLVGSQEYVEHWTNRWSDLLQVNRKFLGADGAQAFRDWIRQAIAENRPYDRFVSEILTASGSNREQPAAAYFKILRDPENLVENTTHLFLGVRFNCNKCHDHPFERWTQDQYYQTAAFFGQVQLAADPASGDQRIGGTAVEGAKPLYEIVSDSGEARVPHERTGALVEPRFPFECDYPAPGDEATARQQLSAWLTSAENPYFARSYVNRLWGYLFGVGLIEPIDDIRAGNPPSNPELLDYLEQQFVASGFDVQHMLRLITRSRTYQLSLETHRWNEDDRRNYSRSLARRLPAEVLYDAAHFVTGTTSQLPGLPPGARAAMLADADSGLPDGFLNNLGRPVRESACECERTSELQLGPVMALISGPTIGATITGKNNDLQRLLASTADDQPLIEELYLRILNRPASPRELELAMSVFARMEQDHHGLEEQLVEREAWWRQRRPELLAARQADLDQARQAFFEHQTAIEPQRIELEQERQQRIDAANRARADFLTQVRGDITGYLGPKSAGPAWSPLAIESASASTGALLRPAEDRSLTVSGSSEPGIYDLTFELPLSRLAAIRLEALPLTDRPGGGPGLAANGNFVVTELQIGWFDPADPDSFQALPLVEAQADYTQGGFSPQAAINGQTEDQGGWAVHPAGGAEHWLVAWLAEPLEVPAGAKLRVRLHQRHAAAEHRLGRFRLSVSGSGEPRSLGLSEWQQALLRTSAEQISEASIEQLVGYVQKSDSAWAQLEQRLREASAPVPADAQLTALQADIDRLEQPLAEDARLLKLRADFALSQEQLARRRLTAAEDLVWALINSPAFLFNH